MVGNIYQRRSDYQNAEKYYRKATELEPDNSYALYGLGNCQRGAGHIEEAIDLWSQILDKEPYNQNILSRLGDAWMSRDESDKARELYERTGGMDERFEGWGAEDDAMSRRVAHFAHNAIALSGYPAYHLWHPVDTQYQRESIQVLRNYALLTAYSEYSESFYQALAKADALRNAELDKYTPTSRLRPKSVAQPLISCLCVTRDRVDLLSCAIECFQRQTWPSRELVIVCEDDDSDTVRYLGQIEDDRIQMRIIPAQPKRSLGVLRNLSIDRANGEYICQWDDDDWCHPQRLARQLEYLQASGKGACVLARWLIYDTQQHKAWCSNTRLWEGSLLCKKALIQGTTRYADTPTGEDSCLIEQLYVQDQLTVYDQPDLYVYMVSGRNTWDDAHFSNILRSSSPLAEKDTKRLARMIGIK